MSYESTMMGVPRLAPPPYFKQVFINALSPEYADASAALSDYAFDITRAVRDAANGTLYFPAAVYDLPANVVIPANVTVMLAPGVSFTGAGGLVYSGGSILDFRSGAMRVKTGFGLSDLIAIGENALASLAVASQYGSVAIGHNALRAQTTGDNNVAIGHYALETNIAGSNSTAVGVQAGRFATAGNQTAVGAFAASNTSTGSGNTAIGTSALESNTTGFDNVALGVNALYESVAGFNNVALGTRAIYSNNTGHDNVAVGVEAMYGTIQTVQGTENFISGGAIAAAFVLGAGWTNGGVSANKSADGVGTLASVDGIYDYGVGATYTVTYTIENLTAGSVLASFGGVPDPAGARAANGTYSFVAVPTSKPAGFVFTPTNTSRFSVTAATVQGTSAFSATSNTAVGTGALYQTTSGSNNVAVGLGAHRQHTTGADNVVIGVEAGVQNGTGSKNTFLGRFAGYAGNTTSRGIFVGYMAGRYETSDNTLIVDAFDRGDEAASRAQAIIYGLMNAAPGNQVLVFNASVTVSYGLALTANDLTLTAGYGIVAGGSRVVSFAPDGIAVNGKFGVNGAAAVGKYALGAAATDAASTQTLANNLRAMAIACGLGQ